MEALSSLEGRAIEGQATLLVSPELRWQQSATISLEHKEGSCFSKAFAVGGGELVPTIRYLFTPLATLMSR
jgi:hypothetical protein